MAKNCDLGLENAAAWHCIDIFRKNKICLGHSVWANYSCSFSFDILCRLLEAFQRSRIAPNVGPGTHKYRAATEMMREIEALERKLFFEQVALNVTENRCDFLDDNYR